MNINVVLLGSRNPSLINLTQNINICETGETYLHPRWASDGNKIAVALGCGDGSYDLFLVSNVQNLLNEPQSPPNYINLTQSDERDGALGLEWSNDDTKIVFVSSPDATDRKAGIYLLDVKATIQEGFPQVMRLTDTERPEVDNHYAYPTWKP